MVGIDMKMSKCCGGCIFYCIDEIMKESYCYLTDEDIKEYNNEKHPKCPLIDLDVKENENEPSKTYDELLEDEWEEK